MSDVFSTYKNAQLPLPAENLVWEMYGAGLENFGKDGLPVSKPLPEPGPDDLLLRTDAVGICFSDVKLTNQGPEHPRITGRDLVKDPVIPGHEVAVTVVKVGANLTGQYRKGERFIVQADVFKNGVSMAYGYVLPGGMQQYGIVGPEVLNGDEGSYLLPMHDETGYVQAALAEPWACVVAAYRIEQRKGLKPGGVAWFYNTATATDTLTLAQALSPGACPSRIVTTNVKGKLFESLSDAAQDLGLDLQVRDGVPAKEFRLLLDDLTGGDGFDDIIVLGTPSAEEARDLARMLGRAGAINIVASDDIGENVEIDIGRIHYDNLSLIGSAGPDITLGYQQSRRSELLAGGTAWFIGAAGPMGQMHVQRAVELDEAPAKILCTDVDDSRMEMLRLCVERTAASKNIDIHFVNPTKLQPAEMDSLIAEFTEGTGFDDVVTLVPVAALIADAARHVADYGVMNIFAGVPRGTKALLPLSDSFRRHVRYIGSSGSRLSDLEDTLHLSEEGKLSTANSAAAIGGMNAMREGIAAVKNGLYPGKTVIFPQFVDFPLTALPDLHDVLPTVHAKLKDGMFWTAEAEEEFFRVMLQRSGASLDTPETASRGMRRLEGKTALVTGAAQGLGEALARRLAEEGANVALVDLNLDGVSAAAHSIQAETGSSTIAFQADVTNEQQIERAVLETAVKFGALDIVVSNAGILIAGAVEDFDVAKWRKVMEVNLLGYFVVAKAAAKQMQKQRSGVILQINSKSGKKGSFRNSAYAASKFGGIGLTQSLALELAQFGVRVNAICPGNLLDSPLWQDSLYDQYSITQGISKEEVRRKYEGQVPLGRGCNYDDIANAAVFLASDEASYMTGQAINVTGGQQLD